MSRHYLSEDAIFGLSLVGIITGIGITVVLAGKGYNDLLAAGYGTLSAVATGFVLILTAKLVGILGK
jgi:hypothetical protein